MNQQLTKGKLDQLADRIRSDLSAIDDTRDAWVERTLDLAAALAEARQHFKDNISFGRWLEAQNFRIGKNDRSALVAFGQDIERARPILANSSSKSAELIYRREFRVPSDRKTPKPRKPAEVTTSPEMAKALDAYDTIRAGGVEPTKIQVETQAGVSNVVVRKAFERRKTEEAIAAKEPDLEGLPSKWLAKYETAVRQITRKLEAEYDARRSAEVQRHIDEYLMPFYAEKLARAERIMMTSRKPFTVDEYRQLLAALHPDSLPERRGVMFAIVKDRELLLKPPERDKPLSGSLPATLAELLAMKKTRR